MSNSRIYFASNETLSGEMKKHSNTRFLLFDEIYYFFKFAIDLTPQCMSNNIYSVIFLKKRKYYVEMVVSIAKYLLR